jgi:hypothetical protein
LATQKDKPDGKPAPASNNNSFLAKRPDIPVLLDIVVLTFCNNIPNDAKSACTLGDGTKYPAESDENDMRHHLFAFVRERLELISRLECALWLNGRLPFITPRELFLWRLRQYVEYIWAFQLPDDEDLALIFNSTKLRAGHLTADFVARFRKALLFPIALRRLYRILRNEDEDYRLLESNFPYNKGVGKIFRIPANRYVQDANSLIEEFRSREDLPLRDAALISKQENIMWVSNEVIDLAQDEALMRVIFNIYRIPEGGTIG